MVKGGSPTGTVTFHGGMYSLQTCDPGGSREYKLPALSPIPCQCLLLWEVSFQSEARGQGGLWGSPPSSVSCQTRLRKMEKEHRAREVHMGKSKAHLPHRTLGGPILFTSQHLWLSWHHRSEFRGCSVELKGVNSSHCNRLGFPSCRIVSSLWLTHTPSS